MPLRLEAVTFEAGGKRLIKEIDCTLAAGPVSIVIGPNGAGKSLLLRLCHNLLRPTVRPPLPRRRKLAAPGRILWTAAKGIDPARHQAMVFQRPVMLRRSVAANVEYALALRRIPRRQRAGTVEEVLTLTGLRRFAEQPARVLSFGEQQKLALARAWALKPQVLFLDEPTASLDPAATRAVEEIVLAIRTGGTKIVMTTHDLPQASRLADEILFLHRGRLYEQTPADRFFVAPRSIEARQFLEGKALSKTRPVLSC